MNPEQLDLRDAMEGVDEVDVVIVGGGPAGSSVATFLADRGYDVLLLERTSFPRFHVGESLLPMSQPIWEQLGVAEKLQHFGQTFKYGAEWRVARPAQDSEAPGYDKTCIRFHVVPRQSIGRRMYAYQVVRSEFDELLLRHAEERGVKVIEKASVTEVLFEDGTARGVRWSLRANEADAGSTFLTRARFIVDASGRSSLLARQLKLRLPDPHVRTAAVFGHFQGIDRERGIDGGNIILHFLEGSWVWFIPLRSGLTSVGLVANDPIHREWRQRRPEEILRTTIMSDPIMAPLFESAKTEGQVRAIFDLPYHSRKVAGDGWMLVGDAGFFVDPLFSSGVHVAFSTSQRAANAIDECLRKRSFQPLKHYAQWNRRYWQRVSGTVRRVYRLTRYRQAISFFVAVTGRYGNHWDNFYLRRINAWGLGAFDRFRLWLIGAWVFLDVLYLFGRLRHLLQGETGWESIRTKAAPTDQSQGAAAGGAVPEDALITSITARSEIDLQR
jgi:flavin-dependent dehydrogenase